MRRQASSRSLSVTPSTWSKRATALRTCVGVDERLLALLGEGELLVVELVLARPCSDPAALLLLRRCHGHLLAARSSCAIPGAHAGNPGAPDLRRRLAPCYSSGMALPLAPFGPRTGLRGMVAAADQLAASAGPRHAGAGRLGRRRRRRHGSGHGGRRPAPVRARRRRAGHGVAAGVAARGAPLHRPGRRRIRPGAAAPRRPDRPCRCGATSAACRCPAPSTAGSPCTSATAGCRWTTCWRRPSSWPRRASRLHHAGAGQPSRARAPRCRRALPGRPARHRADRPAARHRPHAARHRPRRPRRLLRGRVRAGPARARRRPLRAGGLRHQRGVRGAPRCAPRPGATSSGPCRPRRRAT